MLSSPRSRRSASAWACPLPTPTRCSDSSASFRRPVMAESRPPFRADHVGSLLRPASLKALRVEKDVGRVSAAQLIAAEDASIRDAVRLQEDVGLQGITDGEHRRTSWHMDFLLRL